MTPRIPLRTHRNRKTSCWRRGRRLFLAHPEALEERSLLTSLSIANSVVLDSPSGTTPMTFTVSLSAPSSQYVTVGYTTVGNGTAVAGVDYLSTGGTLTFTPGQTTQKIPVTVLGNPAVRPDVNFTVALSNPTFATIAQGVAVGTIVDGPQTLALASFAVSAPTTATAGMGFPVTITAQDRFGNTDSSYNGPVTLTSSDGQTISGLPASVTLSNG